MVDRIGVVHEFTLPRQKAASEELMSLLIKTSWPGCPEDFRLRVSLKSPVQPAMVKGNLSDFENVILTIAARKAEDLAHGEPEEITLNPSDHAKE